MNPYSRSVFSASVLLLAGLSSLECFAQVNPWEFETYPYATAPQGMAEFEASNAVITEGHNEVGKGTSKGIFASQKLWYSSYEITYGLTDRIEAALYLNLGQPNGGRMQLAGSNLRVRGRLFDQDTFPVNVGWYAELEWHKTPQFDDAIQELELRPIIEKDFGALSVMLNPKFEKVLAGPGRHQGAEFGYAAALHYRYSRRLSPGVEFYGGTGLINHSNSLRDQQHYVFATLWGELPMRLEYNVGVGWGLTPGSDRIIFKLNLELERFVGAIFKMPSERSWFF